MKKIKFKNSKIKSRNKVITFIILSLILTFYIASFIINSVSSNIYEYSKAKVKKENLSIIKEAFYNTNYSKLDVDKLIDVIKNSKEEILEVNFHLDECSKILMAITEYINKHVENLNFKGYRLDIPLGYKSASPLLINISPKIPIKVEISDVALGNVRTNAKSFGINNALIEVYLDIYIKTTIIYPSEIIYDNTEFSSLVSSKIISGNVPSFYNGTFTSKSDMINLPLTE